MSDATIPTRRSTLRLFASAPAAAFFAAGAVATVSATDPVFAAIDRHKEAVRIWLDAETAADAGRAIQEGLPKPTEADIAHSDRASAAETKAFDELFVTLPTSIAGLRAAIEHIIKYDEDSIPEASGRYLATLPNSPLFAV